MYLGTGFELTETFQVLEFKTPATTPHCRKTHFLKLTFKETETEREGKTGRKSETPRASSSVHPLAAE